MKLVCVSGARGSGKTTLIRELIACLGSKNLQSAVIVNEEGQAAYDEDFVQTYNLPVKYLRGG